MSRNVKARYTAVYHGDDARGRRCQHASQTASGRGIARAVKATATDRPRARHCPWSLTWRIRSSCWSASLCDCAMLIAFSQVLPNAQASAIPWSPTTTLAPALANCNHLLTMRSDCYRLLAKRIRLVQPPNPQGPAPCASLEPVPLGINRDDNQMVRVLHNAKGHFRMAFDTASRGALD